jgi:hypothetical protein
VTGDGRVSIADVFAVVLRFGSMEGQPRYRPSSDLNDDGLINIRDIVIVVQQFGNRC